MLALKAYCQCASELSIFQRKRLAATINKEVAKMLINTPATCRKYYIHPQITSLYLNGNGHLKNVLKKVSRNFKPHRYGLSIEEQATIAVLSE